MPEGKRPLGSPRCRWEDNFKIELPGIKLVAWIDLARDRDKWYPLFNIKIRGSKKCGEFQYKLRHCQLLNTLLAQFNCVLLFS